MNLVILVAHLIIFIIIINFFILLFAYFYLENNIFINKWLNAFGISAVLHIL